MNKVSIYIIIMCIEMCINNNNFDEWKSMVSDTSILSLNNVELGCRIECSDYYGTIRYIGPVEGHPSTWLGIEWDDATRGKHNGTVSGVCYFTTSEPTGGSFVRPGRVRYGRDAVTGITTRYGCKQTASEANVNQIQLLNIQKEIKAPFLELVGFDKIELLQSNLQDLLVVCLRLQYINGPGPSGQLASICPNLTELDISKNLFSKWTDIFAICEQLPKLTWINVSENLLQLPPANVASSFPSVTSLVCGRMRLNWNDDILMISKVFPSIKELRIQHNLIRNIEIANENCLKHLELLDMEGNRIESWHEINKLSQLKQLKTLMVTNNGIDQIKFEECEPGGKIDSFEMLAQLTISENNIANWESISELNKLKRLEELRCLKNPILNTDKMANCKQYILARIGHLKMLNGSEIENDERNGAEYDYIKKYGKEWLSIADDASKKQQFLLEHPRYSELIEKHGIPEESEMVIKLPSLNANLTTITIECYDKVISKRIPPTMTLQKLIMLVQKLFKLPHRPNLTYVSHLQPDVQVPMIDEYKEISYYSIQDGDKICVNVSFHL